MVSIRGYETILSQRARWASMGVFLLGWGLLLLILSMPVNAQTDTDIVYDYRFGQVANFTWRMPSDVSPQTLKFYLRIVEDNAGYTHAYTATLEQGRAYYQQDLRANPLPPFGQIVFWWEYRDPDGQTQRTAETSFIYEDNRYQWHVLDNQEVTLHWVSGDDATMLYALDVAHIAIQEIQNALQIPDPGPLSIYVYPSVPDLQSALRLAGYNWIGGEAHPEVGVVLLAIPPTSDATLKIEHFVPHEITHVLLYRLVGPQAYANLPTWLTEGLASHFEQRADPTYALALEQAREARHLIPLDQLCGIFPLEGDQVILAYAESQSLVSYVQQNYGWSRLRALLNSYSDGLSCSEGVHQALGVDLLSLERDWRIWLERAEQPDQSMNQTWVTTIVLLREMAPWLILMSALVLPSALFVLSSR